MAQISLRVLKGENFSCHSCTDCCRGRDIVVTPDEVKKIAGLNWSDPAKVQKQFFKRVGDRLILLKKVVGGPCVFLNEANNLCSLHEEFGVDAKPLVCRVYPYKLACTGENEVSVMGSFDCPTIRANEGTEYAKNYKELLFISAQQKVVKPFNRALWAGFNERQVADLLSFLATHIGMMETAEEQALMLQYVVAFVEGNRAEPPTKESLSLAMPTISLEIEESIKRRRKHALGWANRNMFLAYLKAVWGDRQDLIKALPAAKLFSYRGPLSDPDQTKLITRVVRLKLLSRQFMGEGYFGAHIFEGLYGLAFFYPVALATALAFMAIRNAAQGVATPQAKELKVGEQDGSVDPNASATIVEEDEDREELGPLDIHQVDMEAAIAFLEPRYSSLEILTSTANRMYHASLVSKSPFTNLVLSV